MDLAQVRAALAVAASEPQSDEESDEARRVLADNYDAIVAALIAAVAAEIDRSI